MAIVQFQQTDSAPTCGDGNPIAGCSGRSITAALTSDGMAASVGGSAGSTPIACTMQQSESNVAFHVMDLGPMPTGYSGVAAGTAVVRVNTSTVFTGTPSVTEVHICKVASNCTGTTSCGSLTGQTTNLADLGVDSWNVTTSAVAFGATDRLLVILVGTNASSMTIAAGQFTPDQLVDIPLTPAPSGNDLLLLDCGT